MNREHANALSALRWLIDTRNAEASLRLAAALSRFWWVIGFVRQGIERVDLALDLAAREPSTEQLNRAHAAALLQKAPGMFYLGKYAAAEVCATEGLGLIGASGAPRERAYGVTLLGNCALARGNVAQAENLFEEALKLFSEAAHEAGMARSVMDLGRVAWIRQDHARACALLLDCAPRLAALGDLWSAAFAFRTLALAACYRGDLRVAQAQLRQSLRIWRKVGGRVLLAQLLEAAAVVIVAAGRHAQGLMLGGAAATQRAESDSLPTPTWQHELDGWLNRARIAVGPEASSAAWTDGQALSGEAALSAAEAVDWPAEPPPVRRLPASPTRSPGLTARELEILRLVAAGNTNKEIAAQLQVTVATVERHLANAYAKIGARGRAEATAFVVTSEFLATSNR